MSLNLARHAASLNVKDPVIQLYRSMIKEVPKVLSVYDLDIPVPTARQKIREHFQKNSHIKDVRVREMLVNKGYMELEETLMQWKQKAQLMRIFESVGANSTGRRGVEAGKMGFLKQFFEGTVGR